MGGVTVLLGLITVVSVVYSISTKLKNSSLQSDLLKLEDLLFQTTTINLKLKHQNILLTNKIDDCQSEDYEKVCLTKDVVLETKTEEVKPKKTRNKKSK